MENSLQELVDDSKSKLDETISIIMTKIRCTSAYERSISDLCELTKTLQDLLLTKLNIVSLSREY